MVKLQNLESNFFRRHARMNAFSFSFLLIHSDLARVERQNNNGAGLKNRLRTLIFTINIPCLVKRKKKTMKKKINILQYE